MKKRKAIEVFAGTKSFGKEAWAMGYDVLTIDNDPEFRCDITHDMLVFDFKHHPFLVDLNPDIFWASVPCTTYSMGSCGTHWGGGKGAYIPKTLACKQGLRLLKRTVEMIDYFKRRNPKLLWFIENPTAMMRVMIDQIFKEAGFDQGNAIMPNNKKPWMIEACNSYVRNNVTYCRYGDTAMKPTDIWTNCNQWIPREKCKNGNPDHADAPRGSKTEGSTQGKAGARNRGIVPPELCREIILACEQELNKDI